MRLIKTKKLHKSTALLFSHTYRKNWSSRGDTDARVSFSHSYHTVRWCWQSNQLEMLFMFVWARIPLIPLMSLSRCLFDPLRIFQREISKIFFQSKDHFPKAECSSWSWRSLCFLAILLIGFSQPLGNMTACQHPVSKAKLAGRAFGRKLKKKKIQFGCGSEKQLLQI